MARPSPRILFVDGDPDTRDVVAKALGEEGHMVTTAADLAAALAAVDGGGFDLIVTDSLGGLSRTAGCWALLLKANGGTPVGIFTAWPIDGSEQQQGFAFALPKPSCLESLLAAIDLALKH